MVIRVVVIGMTVIGVSQLLGRESNGGNRNGSQRRYRPMNGYWKGGQLMRRRQSSINFGSCNITKLILKQMDKTKNNLSLRVILLGLAEVKYDMSISGFEDFTMYVVERKSNT